MRWQFDPAHTIVQASAKHMMFTTVRVNFKGTRGEIEFEPGSPEQAWVTLSVPADSLSSNDDRRDGHLKSADFLDVANHPDITFKSTRVQPAGKNVHKVTGDLAIRGATRPVTVDVLLHGIYEDQRTGQRAFLDASVTIDRREWGLVWNMPVPQGLLVGNEVIIEFSIEAVPVQQGPAAA